MCLCTMVVFRCLMRRKILKVIAIRSGPLFLTNGDHGKYDFATKFHMIRYLSVKERDFTDGLEVISFYKLIGHNDRNGHNEPNALHKGVGKH